VCELCTNRDGSLKDLSEILILVYQTTGRHTPEIIAIRNSDRAYNMFLQNSTIISDVKLSIA